MIKSRERRGKLDGVRTVLLAVSVCALGAAVAGCGGSGVKRVSAPPWVQRANAICKRDDPKIKAAELEANGTTSQPTWLSTGSPSYMLWEESGFSNRSPYS